MVGGEEFNPTVHCTVGCTVETGKRDDIQAFDRRIWTGLGEGWNQAGDRWKLERILLKSVFNFQCTGADLKKIGDDVRRP